MLRRLTIQNLATLRKGSLELKPGFTVLTGETGAGKSVILKALRLILGAKASKELVRASAKEMILEAAFEIPPGHPSLALLEEWGLPLEEELVIRRKITAEGRGTVLINGFSAQVAQLQALADGLFDLQGQHAQTELTTDANHQQYLDDFAKIGKEVEAYQRDWTQLKAKERELAELRGAARDQTQRAEFLRFQIQEIDQAQLSEEELEGLEAELTLLGQAEKIIQDLSPLANWLEGENNPLDRMSADLQALERFKGLDARLAESYREIDSGLIQIREAASEVGSYLGRLEVNPARLDQVQERLSEIDKLKRKYGSNVTEILEYRDQCEEELSKLEHSEEAQERLEAEIAELYEGCRAQAQGIAAQRLAAKEEFEGHIMGILEKLGMEKCRFEAALEPVELCRSGLERVSFLIAANPGQPLKSLSKIASGGEISRVMLALKSAMNGKEGALSLFFDEIDAGISGRVAKKVAQMLKVLAEGAQVLAITHSPQVAAEADHHFLVTKRVTDLESLTEIHDLDEEGKLVEIAKFLGGEELTESALAAAREMRGQVGPE